MKIKYEVVFAPKYPPYQLEDEWQVIFRFKVGGLPGMKTIGSFKTREYAQDYCDKLNREE